MVVPLVHPCFWWGPCCSSFYLFFICPIMCISVVVSVLGSVLWCPFGFRVGTIFRSSLPPVVMSSLRCLCLFTYSGIHGTCGVLFVLFLFVLCTLYMLSVSLDCPFLIAPSVFSNIYCTRPTPLVIFIVLSHWEKKNSPWVDMSFHSDTLTWFRVSQSLLFLINAAC